MFGGNKLSYKMDQKKGSWRQEVQLGAAAFVSVREGESRDWGRRKEKGQEVRIRSS